MTKNRVSDLNDHLFATLERLNDDDICSTPEKVLREVQRAQAVAGVAREAIANHSNVIKAVEVAHEAGIKFDALLGTPGVIENRSNEAG